jgi:hypothetical protein
MSEAVSTSRPSRARTEVGTGVPPGRVGLGVVSLCLVQFVDVLGVTVVVAALPVMLTDLDGSAEAGSLIATGYAMSFGGLLMFGARLGDLSVTAASFSWAWSYSLWPSSTPTTRRPTRGCWSTSRPHSPTRSADDRGADSGGALAGPHRRGKPHRRPRLLQHRAVRRRRRVPTPWARPITARSSCLGVSTESDSRKCPRSRRSPRGVHSAAWAARYTYGSSFSSAAP